MPYRHRLAVPKSPTDEPGRCGRSRDPSPARGRGTGATGTAYINSAGQVVAITVTGATNYTSAPTVTITGGGGSGATATAAITDAGDLPPTAPNDDTKAEE